MDLHYEFYKDRRTLTAKDGKVYAGQMYDNCSTTLHFDLFTRDEFGNTVEWDPLDEGYYPYLMFLANNPRTKMPFVYGDSSSPIFDGYTFEIPYEITTLRHKSARVEFQLVFIKAGYEFKGSLANIPTAVYLLSAPSGFALKPGPMPELPRSGPACMPMNPISCEPSVVGWIEMWKNRGVTLPVEMTLLDRNGVPIPLTDLNAAAYARNGYELTFQSQRGKRQTLHMDVPVLDAEGKVSVDHLPDEIITAENVSLRLEGRSYDGKYNVLSLLHGDDVISRVDLPIEHLIESVAYDEEQKTINIVFNTNNAGDAAYEALSIPVGNMVTPYMPGDGVTFSEQGSGANKVYYISIDLSEVDRRDAQTLASAKEYADKATDRVTTAFEDADSEIKGRVEVLETKVTEGTSILRSDLTMETQERTAADNLLRTDVNAAASRLDVLDADVRTLKTKVEAKQDSLVAGPGIVISGGSISCDVSSFTDSALLDDSSNPVQNRVVKTALAAKQDVLRLDGSTIYQGEDGVLHASPAVTVDAALSEVSENPVQNKEVYRWLATKQDKLERGTYITLDPVVSTGRTRVDVDLTKLVDVDLDTPSDRPVSCRAVAEAINDLRSRGRTIPNWAESGVTYMAGDVVQYAGALYISLADSNTRAPTSLEVQPESNLPYWSAAVHSDASVNAQVVNRPCHIQLFGNDTDTEYIIEHRLGCRELIWSMYTTDSEHLFVQATVSAPSINRLKVRFSEPPGDNGICISIMRVRDAPQATGSAISGVTVVEVGTESTVWNLPNGTGEPVYVQTYSEVAGKGVTDIMGDVVENPVTDYDPVEVTFGTTVKGAAVIAPVTYSKVIPADETDIVTITPSEAESSPDGGWYLVQCFAEGTLEGRTIVEVDQTDAGVTIETGDFPQDVVVALYKATKTVAIDKDNSSQVVEDGVIDENGKGPCHWHYQHNQNRYVGVQVYIPGKGLANPGVDIELGLNTVDVYFDEKLSGTLLIL